MDPKTGKVDVVRTEELAKAIVYFRDVDDGTPLPAESMPTPRAAFGSMDTRPIVLRRPGFTSTSKVFGFRNGYGSFDPTDSSPSRDPGTPAGDFSPYRPGSPAATDGVRGDFEEQFLNLMRISNLITTHSDSYTCYVYVVGFRHAGTPDAQVVVQRRVACIIDRSSVTPDRPIPLIQRFSQE